jgi:hypothetical protein
LAESVAGRSFGPPLGEKSIVALESETVALSVHLAASGASRPTIVSFLPCTESSRKPVGWLGSEYRPAHFAAGASAANAVERGSSERPAAARRAPPAPRRVTSVEEREIGDVRPSANVMKAIISQSAREDRLIQRPNFSFTDTNETLRPQERPRPRRRGPVFW